MSEGSSPSPGTILESRFMNNKFILILLVVPLLIIFGTIAIDSTNKSNCKIEAIKNHASADVVALCNRQ